MLPLPDVPGLKKVLATDFTVIIGGTRAGTEVLAVARRPFRLHRLRWSLREVRKIEIVFDNTVDNLPKPSFDPNARRLAIDEVPDEVGVVLAVLHDGLQLPVLWLPPGIQISGKTEAESETQIVVSLELSG